jgi:energy-coupling factor transporter transmembrane protein EcfT
MSILSILEFSEDARNTWIGNRDARVKLMFSLSILIISLWIDNLMDGFIYVTLIFIVVSLTLGIKYIRNFLWSIKWFILLSLIINYVMLNYQLTTTLFIFVIKLIILLLSFSLFNRTTRPEEVVDALIKIKLPPLFAWLVGSSMRQAIFLVEDFQDQQAILKIRTDKKFSITNKLHQILSLLIGLYSQAIINAGELADTLETRGWTKPHKEITLYSSILNIEDLIFVIITIICPFLLSLLI